MTCHRVDSNKRTTVLKQHSHDQGCARNGAQIGAQVDDSALTEGDF